MILLLITLFVSMVEARTLPEIEVQATPADLWGDSGLYPAQTFPTEPRRSVHSLTQQIQDDLGFSAFGEGRPGAVSQVRGSGRSAAEVEVETLGAPLNPPYGGGFDFSTFPSFLWSEYRFSSAGSGTASWDPRAMGGRFSLVPWTYAALGDQRARIEPQVAWSSEGVRRYSVGGNVPNAGSAVMIGFSEGRTRGPSASISTHLLRRASYRVHFHLLSTTLESDSDGSIAFPTPGARQWVSRWIPFVQMEGLGRGVRWSGSAFGDWNQYRYANPSDATSAYNRSTQYGGELTALSENWRISSGIRSVDFQVTDGSRFPEVVFRFQAAREFRLRDWALEPGIRVDGVSRFGLTPSGFIGVTRSINSTSLVFFQTGLSNRYPSLLDRYYSVSGFFAANPDLRPEKIWNLTLGWTHQLDFGRVWAQGVTHWRDDMILSTTELGVLTLRHQGPVWTHRVQAGADMDIAPRIRSKARLSWSKIPDSPVWTGSIRVEHRLPGILHGSGWIGLGAQAADMRPEDWEALAELSYGRNSMEIGMAIENILNRPIEKLRGYPPMGRRVALYFRGQIE